MNVPGPGYLHVAKQYNIPNEFDSYLQLYSLYCIAMFLALSCFLAILSSERDSAFLSEGYVRELHVKESESTSYGVIHFILFFMTTPSLSLAFINSAQLWIR